MTTMIPSHGGDVHKRGNPWFHFIGRIVVAFEGRLLGTDWRKVHGEQVVCINMVHALHEMGWRVKHKFSHEGIVILEKWDDRDENVVCSIKCRYSYSQKHVRVWHDNGKEVMLLKMVIGDLVHIDSCVFREYCFAEEVVENEFGEIKFL
jgi:hypothetical protein